LDILPTDEQWGTLTAIPEKRWSFEEDLYFREVWAEWMAVCDDRPSPRLGTAALLCAKPDAVVGRRIHPMLDYVRSRGFRPFHAQPFSFSRHGMRELWRHDWHVYPAERLAYSTLWYTSSQTVGFLLHDDSKPRPGEPASVRLARLKGSAIASRRRPDELRSALRPPNSVLNFVHVADEPADVLRELGILFDRPERIEMLRAIRDQQDLDRTDAANDIVNELETRYPAHDLDVQGSLDRLAGTGLLKQADVRRLQQWMAEGVKLRWNELCAMIDPSEPGIDRWDFITVASELIPLERAGTQGLMPAVPADEAWA
jgi:hypothetical protein